MIRTIALLITIAAASFGWTAEDGNPGSANEEFRYPKSEDVIVTIIDSFSVPTAQQILGLDYQEDDPYIVIMDNTANLIRGIVPNTGSEVWTMASPGNGNFSMCQTGAPDYTWYANSWNTSDIYRWEPDSRGWTVAFPNPAQTLGRGLAFDTESGCIWEADHAYGLHRIDESGNSTLYQPSWLLGAISGVSLFPYGDDLGIVIAYYDFYYFHFFSFDGASLDYIGEASAYVYNFTDSYGITYNPVTDTFYWSHEIYPSDRRIAELDYEFTTPSSLTPCTWADIKTAF